MSNYLRQRNPDGTVTILFPLEQETISVIEVGVNAKGELTGSGFELDDFAPIPRRKVARLLRNLADNYDATADELAALEPQL